MTDTTNTAHVAKMIADEWGAFWMICEGCDWTEMIVAGGSVTVDDIRPVSRHHESHKARVAMAATR